MIPAADTWGPFAGGLDLGERRVHLRALRQTARFLAGPHAADLCQHLPFAEIDSATLEPACRTFNAMAATDKRAIWASYAALARPAA